MCVEGWWEGTRGRSAALILTGVVEGHFLLDHTAVVFQLSAQLRLVFPQLLLTTDTESKYTFRAVCVCYTIVPDV